MRRYHHALILALFCVTAPFAEADPATGPFTLDQVLGYSFIPQIVAASHGDRIAWVRYVRGVRNVWVAEAVSNYRPRQVTQYKSDDGQEITSLTFSPDGDHLVYVRGGDHDANWPAAGDLAPDPSSSPEQQKVTIWAASLTGGSPIQVAEGDYPAITNDGRIAYIKEHHVWFAKLGSKDKPKLFFFDRGNAESPAWSPDGKRLAFVSERDGDHSFIGIYTDQNAPILYLAPSTGRDDEFEWSKDGQKIAFVRQPGIGGTPEPLLKDVPHPFAIWIADTTRGAGRKVWQSPDTFLGSWPDTMPGNVNLHWAADDRLIFTAELDNWQHLYSISAEGGDPVLLTAGNFMVEQVSESRDGHYLVYSANTGNDVADDDRRHIFRVAVDRAAPVALTAGSGLQWSPVAASDNTVAFIQASAKDPMSVGLIEDDGSMPRDLGGVPADYPSAALAVPKRVTFTAPDGVTIHGQLFQTDDGKTKPGIIFVHGGPPRQMLLGWHYMDYYSNAYAVNQYLATHGFTVLSVNYRLGIGYGRKFNHPEHAGFAGAAEYQDVLAGAHFLQALPGIDSARIGIWGGSYGGYLTAMGLARNSDIFKAGVDFHGVHDWSADLTDWVGKAPARYEKGDRDEAMKTAYESSPISSMDTWKSPVLLIQGDDDRNVHFSQTIDLARRLDERHIYYEEMVIPNEIHGFLTAKGWQSGDAAGVEFLKKELLTQP